MFVLKSYTIFIQTFLFAQSLLKFNLTSCPIFCIIILYCDLLYDIVIYIFYVSLLYTEVETCCFTSVRSVCESVCPIHFCATCNSFAERLYVLACKLSTYFFFAGITALSFAFRSPSKRRYNHTCELSRYFYFAVCSSAFHRPCKRR